MRRNHSLSYRFWLLLTLLALSNLVGGLEGGYVIVGETGYCSVGEAPSLIIFDEGFQFGEENYDGRVNISQRRKFTTLEARIRDFEGNSNWSTGGFPQSGFLKGLQVLATSPIVREGFSGTGGLGNDLKPGEIREFAVTVKNAVTTDWLINVETFGANFAPSIESVDFVEKISGTEAKFKIQITGPIPAWGTSPRHSLKGTTINSSPSRTRNCPPKWGNFKE